MRFSINWLRTTFARNASKKALAALEKIRAIDPKDRNLPTRVSEVFEKQGKIEKAIETLLTSLAEEPAQPNIMVFLARLCIKAGKIEEAERIYDKLVKINKSFLAQTIPFIEVLLAERKLDRALTHIERLTQGSTGSCHSPEMRRTARRNSEA